MVARERQSAFKVAKTRSKAERVHPCNYTSSVWRPKMPRDKSGGCDLSAFLRWFPCKEEAIQTPNLYSSGTDATTWTIFVGQLLRTKNEEKPLRRGGFQNQLFPILLRRRQLPADISFIAAVSPTTPKIARKPAGKQAGSCACPVMQPLAVAATVPLLVMAS